MRLSRLVFALSGVVITLAQCAKPAETQRDMDFQSRDGFALKGTLYSAGAVNPAPAVIFVHDAGFDRSVWEPIALAAVREGYLCLAYDARGHGASIMQNGTEKPYRAFQDPDWQGWSIDVGSALETIRESGADPNNIAIVGAGLGANVALSAAAQFDAIQCAVAVSPELDLKGFRLEPLMQTLRTKPILLMATEGDTAAATACTTLEGLAENFCEVRMYPGTANGADLLAVSDGAVAQILQWLDGVIGSGYGETEPR